jgi:trigger factor
VKITTEKLPKSLISLKIEIDRDQFERGLDQAARRLSQKFPIHGFRPGKAPRFIIERTFGRAALIEEATEQLINSAYKKAIQQEKIEVVGPPTLERIDSIEPFIFTVNVPVPPTVTLGDYRKIRIPLVVEPVTEQMLKNALEDTFDEHTTLQELDEPRPAQRGDQVELRLRMRVAGTDTETSAETEESSTAATETLAEAAEATSEADQNNNADDNQSQWREEIVVLEPHRLSNELYNGLVGMNIGEKKTIVAVVPDDHPNESSRGKKIIYDVELIGIKHRIVPSQEELLALENFNGTFDEFQQFVRSELEEHQLRRAEQEQLNAFIEQLVEQSTFDIPDVIVRDVAESMLEEQGQQFARFGITIDNVLQYRGMTRDQAIEELLPEAEKQVKVNLALAEVIKQEKITVSPEEIEAEIKELLERYDEQQRPQLEKSLRGQLLSSVVSMVIDKKLRARIKAIASGELDEEAASPVVADDAPETHTTSTTHDESAAGADASAGADSGSAVEATAPGEPVSRSTTE